MNSLIMALLAYHSKDLKIRYGDGKVITMVDQYTVFTSWQVANGTLFSSKFKNLHGIFLRLYKIIHQKTILYLICHSQLGTYVIISNLFLYFLILVAD